MTEFDFELRLCANLEAERAAIVSRQLGGGVTEPGRVLDIVVVEPGPGFDQRTTLTNATIPGQILESNLGPGRFRDWRRVLGQGMGARRAIERAIDIGYLEVDDTAGDERVRTVDRYPDDWFDRIIAIENKPDLASPGDLYEQLQFDVTLGLADAVILATESHVTRAHLNRLPEQVGIWRFDPENADIEVVRAPSPLPTDRPGLEVVNRAPGRTDVRPVSPPAKVNARVRLAERAYGKGWRTFSFPPCANIDPTGGPAPGMPHCTYYNRLVHPTSRCGEHCPGHVTAPPPAVLLDSVRAKLSPWVADPPDRRYSQGRLGDGW